MVDQAQFDLSAVKPGMDTALGEANTHLEQYLAAPALNIAALEAARNGIHGLLEALKTARMEGVAVFCAELETVLNELSANPATVSALHGDVLRRALSGLMHYLDALSRGADNAALRLFPQYQELQQLRGLEMSFEPDLFFPDLAIPLPDDVLSIARHNDAAARIKPARSQYQQGLMLYLRQSEAPAAMQAMQQAIDTVLSGMPQDDSRAFWWIASGLLDCLKLDGLPAELNARKLLGRIDQQMRAVVEGSEVDVQPTVNEMLYLIGRSRSVSERVDQIKRHYALERYLPDLSELPPVEAAKLLGSMHDQFRIAEESWGLCAQGNADAYEKFNESVGNLTLQSGKLDHDALHQLARQIQVISLQAGKAGQVQQIAMDMAMALLLLGYGIEHYSHLNDSFQEQARILSERMQAILDQQPENKERLAELISLYCKMQQDAVTAPLAKEILLNLLHVRQGLSAFYGDVSRHDALNGLQHQLAQIQRGLSFLPPVLAEQLLTSIQDSLRFFEQAKVTPRPVENLTLAGVMSTLENYLQHLMHAQKNNVTALLASLEEQSNLHPSVAPEASVPAVQPGTAATLRRLPAEGKELLEALLEEAQEALGIMSALENFLLHLMHAQKEDATALLSSLDEMAKLRQAATAISTIPVEQSGVTTKPPVEQPVIAAKLQRPQNEDQELLEVFLEEAREVLSTMRDNLEICHLHPDSREPLKTIRRGFHTLKGSGRMVGLNDLGEVAWAIERALNKWLQDDKPATPGLLHFINQAVPLFSGWVEALESHGQVDIEATALVEMAQQIERGVDPEAAAQIAEAPVHEPVASEQVAPEQIVPETIAHEQVVIGEITLSPALFNIASEEAKQNALALHEQFTAMRAAKPPVVQYDFMRAAHTLAGVNRTMGFTAVAELAHALESWLQARMEQPFTLDDHQSQMLEQTIAALQEMARNICDRMMPSAHRDLVDQLLADKDRLHEEATPPQAASAPETPVQPASSSETGKPGTPAKAAKPQVRDDVDEQLLPVFMAEADELSPKIGAALRAWREKPLDAQQSDQLKRLLHTLKGSARMAGAMRIGEVAHEMEDRVLAAAQMRGQAGYWDGLESDFDHISGMLEELRSGKVKPEFGRRAEDRAGIELRADRRALEVGAERALLANMLRVRSDVVDRLVNEAGEISVARSRMETEMSAFKEGLLELTGSVARLRSQLREVEIQAESQIQARVSLFKDNAEHFDPLEFDRFTRLQELTRIMNESVHDVQTVQQSLLKNIDETAAAMSAQARLNRELQQGLMNVRMVPFSSISERLYRIVRQTGKELSKRANLELYGTAVELDRSVLEKMAAPFEHLLRNAIAHGLESEQVRIQNGKDPIGEIRLSLRQESNEVVFEFSDDGAGLNFEMLLEKAIAKGLLKPDETASADRLAQLIFTSGISTATEVTEVAGRGIGMDVVRSEIAALGGHIEVSSKSGEGTRFIIHLPLTLAVTQTLMVRSGDAIYAIPSTMIEQVRQVKSAEITAMYNERQTVWQDRTYPLHYLPHLLGDVERAVENQPRNPLLLLRSGEQRIALHVDELLGNQEVVVKNIGPQLARLSGIAGATVLGNGAVVLILNPAQLAQRVETAAPTTGRAAPEKLHTQPLVMIVDDSLTVRKITSRLLTRAGYQVATAKDGVDALEQLGEINPDVMLLDIEMPRMDGFELTKHLRRDAKTQNLPIIMITSRTADKHRDYAMQLGVNAYLGKPYQEDVLLQQIAEFTPAP